jgi:hypothetical protein
MTYGRKATDIVGYTFNADIYCPSHIVARLTHNPGDVNYCCATIVEPEPHLDLIARIDGINREDESTYDSDEFPKVIFASQVESDDDRCATCHEPLLSC